MDGESLHYGAVGAVSGALFFLCAHLIISASAAVAQCRVVYLIDSYLFDFHSVPNETYEIVGGIGMRIQPKCCRTSLIVRVGMCKR